MPLKAELMKCPFCGGPATSTVKDFPPIGLRYGAMCTRCDCWCDFRCETEEKAAERWNTRSIPEARLLKPVSVAAAPDVTTPEGRQKAADNHKTYRENLEPFA